MNPSPHQIADDRMKQAAYYARLSEMLEGLYDKCADFWRDHRAEHKSDTACNNAWHGTEDGRKETKIKLRLKALEKQMAASRSMLDVLHAEARNQM